ncbi:hypothetical protein AK812_SmicGene34329 [Symbiodinium microadriaticum]|uniref:Uncharacterized protein n=1 Tax=Symbiodinium microadriaticum TaxID=2951 RepID=A0A1Q9CPC5_SYMMI|nr:hypothetical protein AK812_SmicGene34329 [Symbiodinium microadriaticum]
MTMQLNILADKKAQEWRLPDRMNIYFHCCVDMLHLAGGPADEHSALLDALLWARDWATERLCAASVAQEMACSLAVVAKSADYLAHGELSCPVDLRMVRVPAYLPQSVADQLVEKHTAGYRFSDLSGKLQKEILLKEIAPAWHADDTSSAVRGYIAVKNAAHIVWPISDNKKKEGCAAAVESSSLQADIVNILDLMGFLWPDPYMNFAYQALNEMRNADQLSLVQVEGKADIYRMVKEEMAS